MGALPKHDVFLAVADPTRRSMLTLLAGQELAIAAIARRYPITRTAINKHLHILSNAGLVRSRRIGRETRYTLEPEPLQELRHWLAYFDNYWEEKLAALKEVAESQH